MFEDTVITKPKSVKINRRAPSYASSAPSESDTGDTETGVRADETRYKSERESPIPPPVEVILPAGIDLKKERPPKEDIQNKLNKYCSVCQVCENYWLSLILFDNSLD